MSLVTAIHNDIMLINVIKNVRQRDPTLYTIPISSQLIMVGLKCRLLSHSTYELLPSLQY